jgi:hypothetical protein
MTGWDRKWEEVHFPGEEPMSWAIVGLQGGRQGLSEKGAPANMHPGRKHHCWGQNLNLCLLNVLYFYGSYYRGLYYTASLVELNTFYKVGNK